VLVSSKKQSFALTGRNTTGHPSRAVPWLDVAEWSVTDDDRRQRAKQYWLAPLHYVQAGQ